MCACTRKCNVTGERAEEQKRCALVCAFCIASKKKNQTRDKCECERVCACIISLYEHSHALTHIHSTLNAAFKNSIRCHIPIHIDTRPCSAFCSSIRRTTHTHTIARRPGLSGVREIES